MGEIWEHTRLWFASGGPVMVPLLGVGLWLWFLLGLRALALRDQARGDAGGVSLAAGAGTVARLRELRHLGDARALDEIEIEVLRQRLGLQRHAAMIDALIVAAPLLGLLGTIGGMVTTFDALTEMALFTQGGGIAGGISEALITTEMGLGIAIPGLLLQRWLRHRAGRLKRRAGELLALVQRDGPGAGEEVLP